LLLPGGVGTVPKQSRVGQTTHFLANKPEELHEVFYFSGVI
jgi:hypothetical protein